MYLSSTHCSDPVSNNINFTPLPELKAGHFPVTLLFVSSHGLLYPEHRTDPIFPADTLAKFPPAYTGPSQYYQNSTQAGILGCVDEYQICKAITGPCWDNSNSTSILKSPGRHKLTTNENVAALLLLSLDLSTACGSIQFRGAEALDAQSKVADMHSLMLSHHQWEVEAEKMFQTSLARMQLNTYDIVRGTASDLTAYHNILPSRYYGIRDMVLIRTVGFKNINFLGLVGILVTVMLLWIVGSKTTDENDEDILVGGKLWENVLKKGSVWGWQRVLRPALNSFSDVLLSIF